MALTHFHDGRILIVTVAGPAPQPAEAALLCEAVRTDLQARRAPALVDARTCGAPGLIECVDRLIHGLDRVPRLAVLLSSSRFVEERAALRLVASEHQVELAPFDNLGLALRWLWWLDSPIPLPMGLRAPASSALARSSVSGERAERGRVRTFND
jgi:hypothetical protein